MSAAALYRSAGAGRRAGVVPLTGSPRPRPRGALDVGRRWWLFGAVLLVAVNLRGPIAAVSPVLPDIRSDLALSAGTGALFTTLPVLCFAVASGLVDRLAVWTGVNRAILLGLLGIVAGTVLRSSGGLTGAVTGTVMIGLAITIGNVLMPVVIKENFQRTSGAVTGVFAGGLSAGAAVTAGVTASLAAVAGWRAGLAAWGLLGVVGAAAWWWSAPTGTRVDTPRRPAEVVDVWRHPTAWAVAGYLGAQSALYYAVTAWLPTQLMDDAGLDAELAGVGMSVFQLLGIAGTLIVPAVAGLSRRQSWLGVAVAAAWTVALVGLSAAPNAWLVWTVVGGVAQGAGISLAFILIVWRAGDTDVARRLSGMAQAVGYTIGAAGPFVIGLVFQHSGGWMWPVVVLLGVCLLMLVSGVIGGRDVTIGPHASPSAAGA